MSAEIMRPRGPACATDNATDESTLLALVRRGDQAACEELVHRHAGIMLAVARRLLRCEQSAADAVQDAFLAAFRSIHEFAGESRIGTWLHRIVVNACLMKLRSARNRSAVSIDSLLPSFDETGHHSQRVSAWRKSPADELHTSELRARVREGINALPETYRTVLLLRDIEQLDTDETARRLGITPSAVKVRVHRARQALRTLLDPMLRAD